MSYIPRKTGDRAVDRELSALAASIQDISASTDASETPIVVIPLVFVSTTYSPGAVAEVDATFRVQYDFSNVRVCRLVTFVETAGSAGSYLMVKPNNDAAGDITGECPIDGTGIKYSPWTGVEVAGTDCYISLWIAGGGSPKVRFVFLQLK
jgi:hypothetical protein